MNFQSLMASLARIGVWDIVLPFMLIFTIVYAILTTTLKSIFGKTDDHDNSKFAVVISFVIALGVVIPHAIGAYPPGGNVVVIINTALPQVSLVAIAILGVMILLGMFGIDTLKFAEGGITVFLIAAALGIITYIFGSAAGWWVSSPRFLGFLNDGDTQALIVTILVFGLIVKFITKTEPSSSSFTDKIEKVNKALFGKGGSE